MRVPALLVHFLSSGLLIADDVLAKYIAHITSRCGDKILGWGPLALIDGLLPVVVGVRRVLTVQLFLLINLRVYSMKERENREWRKKEREREAERRMVV